MFFLTNRTKASFFNNSKMTFLVHKDCVDIIFKIKRGVYLTVSVYSLSEGRMLLACSWENYWDRLKQMKNPSKVLATVGKSCPLTFSIFVNTNSPHFAYLDSEQKQGAIVLEMKAPMLSNSVADYLHDNVVEKAVELMNYNLDLYVELSDKCPFPTWKRDLLDMV